MGCRGEGIESPSSSSLPESIEAGASKEKSSIDAASEGEVKVDGVGSAPLSRSLVFNDLRVGRFGVDREMKPIGTGLAGGRNVILASLSRTWSGQDALRRPMVRASTFTCCDPVRISPLHSHIVSIPGSGSAVIFLDPA